MPWCRCALVSALAQYVEPYFHHTEPTSAQNLIDKEDITAHTVIMGYFRGVFILGYKSTIRQNYYNVKKIYTNPFNHEFNNVRITFLLLE